MKRIIINADDFGLTSGVNQAIIDCYRKGTVTSATLLVRAPAAREAAGLAAANPGLGVGLHLNLTSGPPAMPADRVPSLVDGGGNFPGLARAAFRLTAGLARSRELEAELLAQIGLCRELGVEPTHIDSHHHLHAHPRLRAVIQRVCPQAGIGRMRGYRMKAGSVKAAAITALARVPVPGAGMKSPDRFFGVEVMGGRDFSRELGPVLREPGGTLEFMCHPGYADDELLAATSYAGPRQQELESLLSDRLVETIAQAGVEAVSFAAL